jgi:hypothetical protein
MKHKEAAARQKTFCCLAAPSACGYQCKEERQQNSRSGLLPQEETKKEEKRKNECHRMNGRKKRREKRKEERKQLRMNG